MNLFNFNIIKMRYLRKVVITVITTILYEYTEDEGKRKQKKKRNVIYVFIYGQYNLYGSNNILYKKKHGEKRIKKRKGVKRRKKK